MAILGNRAPAEIGFAEWGRDELRLEHLAAAKKIDHETVVAMPSDREFAARKTARRRRARRASFGLVVVEIRAAQEEHGAVRELQEVVQSFVLEFLHAKSSLRLKVCGDHEPVPFEFPNVFLRIAGRTAPSSRSVEKDEGAEAKKDQDNGERQRHDRRRRILGKRFERRDDGGHQSQEYNKAGKKKPHGALGVLTATTSKTAGVIRSV